LVRLVVCPHSRGTLTDRDVGSILCPCVWPDGVATVPRWTGRSARTKAAPAAREHVLLTLGGEAMSRIGSGLRKCMVVVGVLALVVPLLFAFAAPVSAATRCVNTGGTGGCFGSIQAAVNAANGGDVIKVYPGTYDESVNVSAMNSVGDLTLVTVNNAGTPAPGTVTVEYHGQEAEFWTEDPGLNGDLTIDGFIVHSAYPGIEVEVDGGAGANRNLVIRNVTATETEHDGIRVSADGNVTISNCLASDNDYSGIHVNGADGDVVITDSTANGNGDHGIFVNLPGVASTEAGVAAIDGLGGDITITNSTANDNEEHGFLVVGSALDGVLATNGGGNVTITNCTAKGNGESGFDPRRIPGQLTIQDCLIQDNEEAVDLNEMSMATGVLVNGNIICGNDCGIANPVSQLNAEGNWWGCAGGPGAVGCDPICQIDSIAVDFTPWISKITSGATPDPITVGEPTEVKFQFRGGPPAVYLGQGPGDLRGPAPFTVSTDNGTLNGNGATVHEFINAANGTLEVTLVPDRTGTATVTVSGPCGLGDLEGAVAVLGVVAAQEEFVPELGSVMLLGSGLMGLAGYAGLRLRKR
jgi:parallel beta-helix repeat protein